MASKLLQVLGVTGAALCLALSAAGGAQEGEPILELQTLLAERGCDPGPLDGEWGRRTGAALDMLATEAGLTIARPVSQDHLDKLRESDARCSPFLNMTITEAAQAIPAEDVVGWDGAALRASATANEAYCKIGPRNGGDWVGPLVLQRAIEIIGEDLAWYKSATDPFLVDLNRLIATAASTGDNGELKALILDVVENGHFTEMKPYHPVSWEGTKPDWVEWYSENIPDAEPAFNAAVILIPASMAFTLLEPELSPQERDAFRAWGDAVFRLAYDARKDGMRNASDRAGSGDRRAAYAAGFLAWGATTGNRDAFLRGAELYEEGVLRIRADGSERGFVGGQDNSGLELKYQNFAYGLLTVAAYVLELNDIPAFAFKRRDSGSLADGLVFHLEATADPAKRSRMVDDQNLDYAGRSRNWGADSLAYLAYVQRAGALKLHEELLEKFVRASQTTAPLGFAGDYYGGYTSCLFKG